MSKRNLKAWEKAKIVGTLIASIAIPISVTLIGYWHTSDFKEKEFGLHYIELAVQILKDKPQNHNENIRSWAIDIINAYSTVKLSDDTKSELLDYIIISDSLDGNIKSSAQLMEEVSSLKKQWKQKNKAVDNLMEEMHHMAKQSNNAVK